MRLIVQRAALGKALDGIRPLIDPDMRGFEHGSVLLTARADTVELTASSHFDVTVVIACPATVEDAGHCMLDTRQLSSVLRNAPGDILCLSATDERNLRVECRNLVARLSCGESVSPMPDVTGQPSVTCRSAQLAVALRQAAACLPEFEGPLNFPVVFVEARPLGEPGALRLVASDGHRLAAALLPIAAGMVPARWYAVPAMPMRAARVLMRLLTGDGDVVFGLDRRWGFFRGAGWALRFDLAPVGMYDWEHYRHGHITQSVTLDRHELTDALARLIGIREGGALGIRLDLAGDDLGIVAPGPDISARVSVRVIESCGQSFSVGLNPKYLLEMLETLDDVHVTLALAAAREWNGRTTEACRIIGSSSAGYFAILMPQKTDPGTLPWADP